MDRSKVWIKAYDVKSPVIKPDSSFEQVLFSKKSEHQSPVKLNLNDYENPDRRHCRRMNRTSLLGFLSVTEALNRSGLLEKDFDQGRIGTAFSTTNASYDSVLRMLRSLYQKGVDAVSPIDFTYSVGNSLISGITMKYKLKGPSTLVPSSEALLIGQMHLEMDEADHMVVGSFNILTDENIDYLKQMPYLNVEDKSSGMPVKEHGVSIILSKDEEQVYIGEVIQMQKKRLSPSVAAASSIQADSAYHVQTMVELEHFHQEDFSQVMKKASKDEEVDLVLMCSTGHESMVKAEKEAIQALYPHAEVAAIGEIFGVNFGSSFLLNVVAAKTILEHQQLPWTQMKHSKALKRVLVNGFNDLGNMISGVVACD